MSLKKMIQTRKGSVSMSVFKAESDGKVLLSLDKDLVSRRIKGPLFSEEDIIDISRLIEDYAQWESRVLHGGRRMGSLAGNSTAMSQAGYSSGLAEIEITQAIQAVREAPEALPKAKAPPRIVVMPTMPKYRYLHTCPRCGCHVASLLRLPGSTIRLCPNCETTY